LGYTWIQRPPE
jgi:hypothetical protein